jgi:hypothetical protein
MADLQVLGPNSVSIDLCLLFSINQEKLTIFGKKYRSNKHTVLGPA